MDEDNLNKAEIEEDITETGIQEKGNNQFLHLRLQVLPLKVQIQDQIVQAMIAEPVFYLLSYLA